MRNLFLFASAVYWGAWLVLLAIAAVSGKAPDLLTFARGAILYSGFWLAAYLGVIAFVLFVSWWFRSVLREHREWGTGYRLFGGPSLLGGGDGGDCGGGD